MRGEHRTVSGTALVAAALAASLALIVTYLALGGSSYAPAAVEDPCRHRPWRSPQGAQESAEQFSLSALDGMACRLHVSRETLVLALASEQGRQRFAADPRLEAAVRAGLLRAIDDAERADALNPLVASALRELAKRAPVDQLVGLVDDARDLFGGAQGLLDQLPELPGLPSLPVP